MSPFVFVCRSESFCSDVLLYVWFNRFRGEELSVSAFLTRGVSTSSEFRCTRCLTRLIDWLLVKNECFCVAMDDEAVEHKQLLAVVIPKNHVQATYYLLWNVARNCKNTKIQKYCNFASHFCKGEDGSVVVFAGCRAGKVKYIFFFAVQCSAVQPRFGVLARCPRLARHPCEVYFWKYMWWTKKQKTIKVQWSAQCSAVIAVSSNSLTATQVYLSLLMGSKNDNNSNPRDFLRFSFRLFSVLRTSRKDTETKHLLPSRTALKRTSYDMPT